MSSRKTGFIVGTCGQGTVDTRWKTMRRKGIIARKRRNQQSLYEKKEELFEDTMVLEKQKEIEQHLMHWSTNQCMRYLAFVIISQIQKSNRKTIEIFCHPLSKYWTSSYEVVSYKFCMPSSITHLSHVAVQLEVTAVWIIMSQITFRTTDKSSYPTQSWKTILISM